LKKVEVELVEDKAKEVERETEAAEEEVAAKVEEKELAVKAAKV